MPTTPRPRRPTLRVEDETGWLARCCPVPDAVDPVIWRLRVLLWLGVAVWGLSLARADVRTGEIGESFLHRPLLIFHEAGHVIFMPFGEWMTVAGGTLGQLLMPAIMAIALWRQGDAFGAAIGLWLIGVSVLDVAPYVYDALQPQLMLLSGRTGEAGGHDWIYLLGSLGWVPRAQSLGRLTHQLGVLVLVASLAWAAVLLLRQRTRLSDNAPIR